MCTTTGFEHLESKLANKKHKYINTHIIMQLWLKERNFHDLQKHQKKQNRVQNPKQGEATQPAGVQSAALSPGLVHARLLLFLQQAVSAVLKLQLALLPQT